MHTRSLIFVFTLAFLFSSTESAQGESPQLRRFDSQLSSGSSTAVLVEKSDLVHTAQLLPLDSAGKVASPLVQEQTLLILQRLSAVLEAYEAKRNQVVKLNVYLAEAELQKTVEKSLGRWFGADALPAVSFVATPLPTSKAKIAIDAVIAVKRSAIKKASQSRHIAKLGGPSRYAHASLLPQGDVVYISGQAEPGDLAEATQATMQGLLRTLKNIGLQRKHIVEVKCFLQPMSDIKTVNKQMEIFFGEAIIPPLSYVEWISGSRPIEIELIAYAPATNGLDSVTFSTPPWMKSSPVFSRVSRIHGDRRIYISGLVSNAEGDGRQQVEGIFKSLQEILTKTGSDMRHLAKATYYVSNDDASSQLNALRPSVYDPKRPPAASKAMVKDVGYANRGITIDMIAAPRARH